MKYFRHRKRNIQQIPNYHPAIIINNTWTFLMYIFHLAFPLNNTEAKSRHYIMLILNIWASLIAQMVKSLPAMQETQVWSLGQEDTLEKGMAICSSILAWRIPWSEDLGRLQTMGLQRVGHDWEINTHTYTHTHTHEVQSSWWQGVCGERFSSEFTTWILPVTIRNSFWWFPRQEVFGHHSLSLSWDIQKDPRRCKISAQDHGQLPHPNSARVWRAA